MGDEFDLRMFSQRIQTLEKEVLGLQQQTETTNKQISSVDSEVKELSWEVRVRLSSALEENQGLQCQVNPYSNDGTSIADSNEF
jgi:predicted  nucleic acid-binding Zn-ribbon protein